MKKFYKILISALLCITILGSSYILPSLSVSAKTYTNNLNKIDNILLKKLQAIDNDENINISAWFNDIDKIKLQDKTNFELKNTNISSSAIKLAFSENNKIFLDSAQLNDIQNENNISIADTKTVIDTKRKIAKEMYYQSNISYFNTIFEKTNTLSLYQEKSPQIIYLSKYAPNIDLTLTKEQIYDMIKYDFVKELYYYDEETFLIDDTPEQIISEVADNSELYDQTWSNMTNISFARDTLGYSGENITVGIFDVGFPDPNFVDYFYNVDIDYSLANNLEQTTYTHGSYMASIIAGRKTDSTGKTIYEGAVPNAKIYCANGPCKATIESLIDKGCNVINMSMVYITGISNTYGTLSMWFDYVSYMHNVHFICAAGNYGIDGIPQSNMIYNAIVVGNCYNSGLIKETSSYATGEETPYKPDIVAPGACTNTPAINNPNVTFGGTSAASAIVCGAVAQLCQMSPNLLTKPTLLKSLLLSSAQRTYGNVTMAPLYDFEYCDITLSRQYGAGLIDVAKAYQTYINNCNYAYNIFTPNSYSRKHSFTINNTSEAKPKLLRFALTWDKANTLLPDTDDSPLLDHFDLYVTTPSGEMYTSTCWFDTKQYISFLASEEGEYIVDVVRSENTNSGKVVSYGLTCSVF